MVISLTGCTTTLSTISRLTPENEIKIDNKNYSIGKMMTATVGSYLIEREIFDAKVLENAMVRPDRDFTLETIACIAGPACRTYIPADRDYEVVKIVEYEGKEYFAVSSARSKASSIDSSIYSREAWHFLVDENGVILKEVFLMPDTIVPNGLRVVPESVKLQFKDRIVKKIDSYVREKIVFVSASEKSIIIRYIYGNRNGSGGVQERTEQYILEKKPVIKFRNYELRIVSADETGIQYIVEAD